MPTSTENSKWINSYSGLLLGAKCAQYRGLSQFCSQGRSVSSTDSTDPSSVRTENILHRGAQVPGSQRKMTLGASKLSCVQGSSERPRTLQLQLSAGTLTRVKRLQGSRAGIGPACARGTRGQRHPTPTCPQAARPRSRSAGRAAAA